MSVLSISLVAINCVIILLEVIIVLVTLDICWAAMDVLVMVKLSV